MSKPTSQHVVVPPPNAAVLLVVTIHQGSEDTARELLADVPGLIRSVGFRADAAHLTATAGISSDAWDRLVDGSKPAQLHTFKELRGDKHYAPSTPGDLIFHIRAERIDLCFELARLIMDRLDGHVDVVDETHTFKYFDQRDLLGFVDGTENPRDNAAFEAALVGEEDPEFTGGSYLIVQKYLHNLGDWHSVSVEEQQNVIGRTKLDDVELPDDIKPSNSHVAANTLEDENGNDLQILRENMIFGEVGSKEFGTYFIGYAGDVSVTEKMLEHMFIGNPPGNYDRILDFSEAATGINFFIPTQDFLESLAD